MDEPSASESRCHMNLRHVVLDFQPKRNPAKSPAICQAEYRQMLKKDPQKWAEYQSLQRHYMSNYLGNLSEEMAQIRKQKRNEQQRERRRIQKAAKEAAKQTEPGASQRQNSLPLTHSKKVTRTSIADTRRKWKEAKKAGGRRLLNRGVLPSVFPPKPKKPGPGSKRTSCTSGQRMADPVPMEVDVAVSSSSTLVERRELTDEALPSTISSVAPTRIRRSTSRILGLNKVGREFSICLVLEVQKRPAIYVPSHPGHQDRCIIDKEWTSIAAQLDSTVEVVKRRWRALRASYSKCLTTLEYQSNGDRITPKRTFYLFDNMKFLMPYMNHSSTTTPKDEYKNRCVEDLIVTVKEEIGSPSHSPSSSTLSSSPVRDQFPQTREEARVDYINTKLMEEVKGSIVTVKEEMDPPLSSPSFPLPSTSFVDSPSTTSRAPRLDQDQFPQICGEAGLYCSNTRILDIQGSIVTVKEEVDDPHDSPSSPTPPSSSVASTTTTSRKMERFQQEQSLQKFEEVDVDDVDTKMPNGDSDLNFFKGLLPMVKELSAKNKLKFYADLTSLLLKHIQQQENDSISNLNNQSM